MQKLYFIRRMALLGTLLILINSFSLQAQGWQWAHDLNGWCQSGSVATDKDGNVFVCFQVLGTAVIGTTTLNAGFGLAKYDKSGNPIWAVQISTVNTQDSWKNLVVDKAGNAYVTGIMAGNYGTSMSFGTITITDGQIGTGGSYFIVKVDGANGNFIWATCPQGNSTCRSMVIDSSGNLLISGGIYSPRLTIGTYTVTNPNSANSIEPFVAKYDSAGNVKWARCLTEKNNGCCTAMGIATDKFRNVYFAAGCFDSTLIFGKDTLINHNIGYQSPLLIKYDSNGNPVWAKECIGGGIGWAMISDTSGGILLTGGYWGPSLVFDSLMFTSGSSYGNIFMVKYDKNGKFIWANGLYGNSADAINALATDDSNNIYMAGGLCSSAVNFGSTILYGSSDGVMFYAKCNKDGAFKWARTVPSGDGASAWDMALDQTSNSLYFTGSFGDSVIFGSNVVRTPTSHEDGYLAKYSLGDETVTVPSEFNKEGIALYPNPARDELNVQLVDDGKTTITIYDIFGKEVLKRLTDFQSQIIISVADLSPGLYLLKAQLEDGNALTKKVEIVR